MKKKTPVEKGEEQMTIDYAVEWVKRSMCYWSSTYSTIWVPFKDERHIAGEMAIKVLENQQKYSWHDLIKNPSELPDDETMVIIQTVTHHQFFAYIRDEQWFIDGEGLFSLADVNDGHISAWRDYDEFEEGE